MKYVKTDSAIYIAIGKDTEIIAKSDDRFDETLRLLQTDAPDKDIIWCIYGDVITRAKEALLKLGDRTL